jgi:hypothetical protein
MWMYDIAREQCPDLDYLCQLCQLSLDSGYNALGLYLEHRFEYPSAPWVAGSGALTPSMVEKIQDDFPDLQIVPFINLLGHFEGFIYTEEGHGFACESFKSMQADPCNPEFVALAKSLVDDTIRIFKSDLIHIGGDETAQLGKGANSEQKCAQYAESGVVDPKAKLYGDHFGALAQHVVDQGRTPAVWGDMFAEHPDALDLIPKQTVVFDWQYFKSSEFTAKPFLDAGFRTVFCPAIHTYNAVWCHLPQSERNVKEQAEAAERLGAEGVCVTTWECGLMGNYNTILPAISASGQILTEAKSGVNRGSPLENATRDEDIAIYADSKAAPVFLSHYLKRGENSEEWARMMGCELQTLGGPFAFGGIRSGIKCRLMLYSNPFLLWLRDRGSLLQAPGMLARELAERATMFAPTSDERGVCQFLVKAIDFVGQVERSHLAYAERSPGRAAAQLAPCRQIFEDLEKVAVATNLNSCGSLADISRAQIARKAVEDVILKVKQYGDGSLGYLPSFETLTHPKFVPHDQSNWWLINTWANE